MEFTVSLVDFKNVLQKLLPAIPPKSTVPVLEHIYMKLSQGRLQLVATDQTITIISYLEVLNSSEGAVLVPARMLNEIVKALGNTTTLNFIVNPDNFEVKLFANKGEYEMKGLDPDDYIDIPQLFDIEKPVYDENDGLATNQNNRAEFTKSQISKLAEQTIYCVSSDEYRIAMTGVFFQFRENYVNAVSTDSFRLSRFTVQSDRPVFPQNFDLLIPAKSLEILKKADSDVVMTTVENFDKITHVRFDMDNTIFLTRVLDDKFPPYESVLPKSNDLFLIVDLYEFENAIKRVSLFAHEKSKQIKFMIEPDLLHIYAEDEDSGKHGKETISCDFNRDNFNVVFNYKYILEALEHIDPKDTNDNLVYLTFSDSTKPALLLPSLDSQETLMLIMPVRISSN
ncbi:MAG: DNA polymerase III subunit beta [Candidatus Kapaibacterium sp.]|jgi:DNA polymerase-3 subunit beta|nr:DNA polymerase III subunit beta [Candidatus Kapabacteria bacterium]